MAKIIIEITDNGPFDFSASIEAGSDKDDVISTRIAEKLAEVYAKNLNLAINCAMKSIVTEAVDGGAVSDDSADLVKKILEGTPLISSVCPRCGTEHTREELLNSRGVCRSCKNRLS
ncbi:TPA: hypothetical protein ACX6NV_000546 [Photobacterium damselae]